MKHLLCTIGSAMLLCAAPLLAKEQKADHVYGPEPDWPSFRQRAEAGIVGRLIDPESARISWMTGIRKGGFKPLLQRSVYGYVACGTVNAKNRMGGYVGAQTFIVVIDYDRVLHAEIDRSSAGLITETCDTGMTRGMFPPVPSDQVAVAKPAKPKFTSPMGLGLEAMMDGAYVSAVAPGSTAEKAGIKPGMVIETINAIPLRDMDQAMLKVVEAAGPKAALGFIGGKIIKVGEQP